MKRPDHEVTEAERSEILRLVDEAIRPVQIGLNRFEVPNEPGPPDECLATIARSSPKPLATREELARLKDLDAEWASLMASLALHGRDRIKGELARRNAALGQSIIAGTPALPASLEGIGLEFAGLRGAAKTEAAKRSQAAAEIVAVVAGRFADYSKVCVADIAVEDFKRFESFGIAYQPSALIRTLRAAITRAQSIAEHPRGGERPGAQAARFGIVL